MPPAQPRSRRQAARTAEPPHGLATPPTNLALSAHPHQLPQQATHALRGADAAVAYVSLCLAKSEAACTPTPCDSHTHTHTQNAHAGVGAHTSSQPLACHTSGQCVECAGSRITKPLVAATPAEASPAPPPPQTTHSVMSMPVSPQSHVGTRTRRPGSTHTKFLACLRLQQSKVAHTGVAQQTMHMAASAARADRHPPDTHEGGAVCTH
jgi:hypothetical protein